MKILGISLFILTLVSCEQSTDPKEVVNVEIETEYNEYELLSNPHIEVRFTLKDYTDSKLYIFYLCRTIFEIEQFKNSEWHSYIGPICPDAYIFITREVEDRIWEESTYIFDVGLYRIKLPISRDSTYYFLNENIQHIYSNEFEVK